MQKLEEIKFDTFQILNKYEEIVKNNYEEHLNKFFTTEELINFLEDIVDYKINEFTHQEIWEEDDNRKEKSNIKKTLKLLKNEIKWW